MQGWLRLLIEAEGLLNEGAAVAFGAGALLVTIVGGVLVGDVVAVGCMLLAGRTPDPLVELTFTTLAAYGSFFVAVIAYRSARRADGRLGRR